VTAPELVVTVEVFWAVAVMAAPRRRPATRMRRGRRIFVRM